MAGRKINPFYVLFPGLILMAVALASLGVGWWSEEEEEVEADIDKKSIASRTKAEASKNSEKKQNIVDVKPVEPREKERKSKSARRAAMTKILLVQIDKSPVDIDMVWIADFCEYTPNEASFQSYFDEILALGTKRNAAYISSLKKKNYVPSTNPHYFLEEARKIIYSSKIRSVEKMKKDCREWLALAYYIEHQQKEGWENIDGLFMTEFFKETTRLYQALQDSALERGKDPRIWIDEKIKTHEATLMDRYLRILRQTKIAREKLKDTGNSGARDQLSVGRLQQQINEVLLALGNIYLEAAEAEKSDITKLQFYTEHTFQAMALVYQRKSSSGALNAIRRINEIQRSYLYRMARVNWQRAEAAVEAGNKKDADEFFFLATQRYLQCLARWGEEDRSQYIEEFRRLKQEIAAWQVKKQ